MDRPSLLNIQEVTEHSWTSMRRRYRSVIQPALQDDGGNSNSNSNSGGGRAAGSGKRPRDPFVYNGELELVPQSMSITSNGRTLMRKITPENVLKIAAAANAALFKAQARKGGATQEVVEGIRQKYTVQVRELIEAKVQSDSKFARGHIKAPAHAKMARLKANQYPDTDSGSGSDNDSSGSGSGSSSDDDEEDAMMMSFSGRSNTGLGGSKQSANGDASAASSGGGGGGGLFSEDEDGGWGIRLAPVGVGASATSVGNSLSSVSASKTATPTGIHLVYSRILWCGPWHTHQSPL